LQESTKHRRRERLSKITGGLGLGDAYDATIERINGQRGDRPRLGIGALMWISYAERPLRADELCNALAIELGSTNFNSDNIPSMSTLVSCCQGLITVDEASTVRLIHFTLQEYLVTSRNIFSTPHATMAEICLTYLNSEKVKAIPADCSPNVPNMPFLKYCSLYWRVHHAKRELSDHTRSLALQLLQECDGHISIKYLLQEEGYKNLKGTDNGLKFSRLHWASFFGAVEVADALIEMGCYDTDAEDFYGCTPLSWPLGMAMRK